MLVECQYFPAKKSFRQSGLTGSRRFSTLSTVCYAGNDGAGIELACTTLDAIIIALSNHLHMILQAKLHWPPAGAGDQQSRMPPEHRKIQCIGIERGRVCGNDGAVLSTNTSRNRRHIAVASGEAFGSVDTLC
ncbi:hypothetical protein QE433_000544 [Agrobacterium tumefaciens]|nr:hypothetical protein [Agrobacterium tumefaciens]